MGRFFRLTLVPFFLPLLPTQESVRSKSLSNQSRPELLAWQSSWSSSSSGLSRFPPKQSWYLSQKWSFLCLPLMRSFMRVPRLLRKAMDLMAGSMTSLDQPDELSGSGIADGYASWSMFYFFNQEGDSSAADTTFLRPFLAILGFQFLLSPSILTHLKQNQLQTHKITKKINSLLALLDSLDFPIYFAGVTPSLLIIFKLLIKLIAIMKPQILAVLLLAASVACSHGSEFIDFTYTQLLEESNYRVGPKDKIIIHPETLHLEKYQFPEVCGLEEQLREGTDSSGTVDHIINMDDYLTNIKQKILNLLTLAEQIKNTRRYLVQISRHIELHEEAPIEDKFKAQLQSLAKKESQLAALKQKIQSLTLQLNGKIDHYNANPSNEQFKAVSLNYNIENYEFKISYLKDLRARSISKANTQPHTNFTDFFNSLGLDLAKESQQIEFIDKYFQNMSHISYLRDRANSLRDNIEVDRLNIDYKRSCEKEKQQIISKSSSHAEIKATLNHLRQKKKEFGNTANKYCEGVALKLQMQIKRLLKAINWTFMCADGLPDLIKKREDDMKQLANIQKEIAAYGEDGFDQYQKTYQNIRHGISAKFEQIKTFTIDQYTHDPLQIDQLISEAEAAKRDAQDKLRNMPVQVNTDQLFHQIRELADLIKAEKAKFCEELSGYDLAQRRVWFLIYAEEQSRTYASKMRGQFIAESQRLQLLQEEYKEISEAVVGQLTDNHEAL